MFQLPAFHCYHIYHFLVELVPCSQQKFLLAHEVLSYQVSQLKRPAFEKILRPEYQSNDIEICLVLSSLCQIKFSNLPAFNRSFLPVEMGDFLQIVPFENLQKRVKHQAKFPFVLLPNDNDSWICSCILSS